MQENIHYIYTPTEIGFIHNHINENEYYWYVFKCIKGSHVNKLFVSKIKMVRYDDSPLKEGYDYDVISYLDELDMNKKVYPIYVLEGMVKIIQKTTESKVIIRGKKQCIGCNEVSDFQRFTTDIFRYNDEWVSLESYCSSCRNDIRKQFKTFIQERNRIGFVKMEFTGYVYFLQEKLTRTVKIGCTMDPRGRIEKTFGVQLPFETELLFMLQARDYKKTEHLFHKYFEDKRRHGEWFALQDSDIEWIKQGKYSADITKSILNKAEI